MLRPGPGTPMTLADAAQRVGVTAATLRRWIGRGLVPQYAGEWTPATIGQARVVAKMRERGHSLKEIRAATEEGRLAFGFLEELFPSDPHRYSFTEAARATGLDLGLVSRLIAGLGVNIETVDTVSEDELQLLRYVAGYTRLTEEEGELSALDAVERFVEAVEVTLPDEARIIKTIGDEVMIIGSDASALTDWAVGFQTMQTERPLPRIAVHCGVALFRDGDYYSRDINIASRVAARPAGGEVLVTRPVVDVAGAAAGGGHLEFERIGEVTLKGFSESTEVFLARQHHEDGG
jgi:class 3 adenylate cyclase